MKGARRDLCRRAFDWRSSLRGVGTMLSIAVQWRHLRRTVTIAFVIGTWLTAFNQGDVIITGAWTAGLVAKVALNYATPFVVSNLGLLARRM